MIKKRKLISFMKKYGISIRYIKGTRIIQDLINLNGNVMNDFFDEMEGLVLALSDFSPDLTSFVLKRCERMHIKLLNNSFSQNNSLRS